MAFDVPVYEQKQVGTGKGSKPYVSPSMAGLKTAGELEAGEAYSGLGGVLQDQSNKIQEHRDLMDAMDAANSFRDEEREFLKAETSQRGKGARNATTRGVTWYEERRKAHSEKLTDNSRLTFEKLTTVDRESGLDSLSRHEQAQEYEVEKEVAERSFKSSVDNVVLAAGDDDTRERVIRLAMADIDTLSVYSGKDKAGIKAEAEKAMRVAALKELIETNPMKAKEFLADKGWKKALGAELTPLIKQVEQASVRKESQVESDRIMSSFGTYSEQLKEARKITDPEVRDATEERVKARHVDIERIEDENRKDLIRAKSSEIIDVGSYEAALDIAKKMRDGEVKTNLIALAKAHYLREDTLTDYEKFIEARQKIDAGQVESEQALFYEYRKSTSKSDWNELRDYYKGGGYLGELKDSTVRTIFKSLYGKDANDTSTTRRLYQQTWDYIKANVTKDKTPTDADLRRMVSAAITTGERQGGGFGYGDNLRYSEAVAKGLGETWLPDITGDESSFIDQQLKKSGDPVNTFTRRLYKRVFVLGLPMTKQLKDQLSKEGKK